MEAAGSLRDKRHWLYSFRPRGHIVWNAHFLHTFRLRWVHSNTRRNTAAQNTRTYEHNQKKL